MADWYVYRDDERYGPYETRDLRSMAIDGQLQPDDKLWKYGLDKPIRARQIKGLFPASSNGDLSESHPSSSLPDEDDVDDGIFDRPLESSRPRPGKKRVKAKEVLSHGVDAARKAVKTGTDRIRATFGAAMMDTVSTGVTSFGELLAHPIQYAFGTLVLLIACTLSIPGLVTIVLIPVFVLGYIPYIQSILRREPASLGNFIHFMRHGWDSLWHLLMLLGTFFISAAIAIAPFVITGMIMYATIGTLSLGGLQITRLLSTESSNVREFRERMELERSRDPERVQDFEEQPKDGFVTHVIGAINALMKNAKWFVGILLTGLIGTALLTPSGSILILVYCITLMVATRSTEPDATYDLVYEAFQRMLLIARSQWKRLLTSGLWLVALPIVWVILTTLLSTLMTEMHLMFVAAWISLVLNPLLILGFVIYVNIFSVKTAMQLVESQVGTQQ